MKRSIVIFLLASLGLAAACEVPVFRFALERWPADPLSIEVQADSSSGDEVGAALKWLRNQVEGQASSNITLKFTDPTGPSDGRGLLRLFPAEVPRGNPEFRALWEGPLSEINARRLTGSPAREDIARRLVSGTSAVWVVVSRGDAAADEKAMEAVRRGTSRAMQELSLPSGVIHAEEAAEKFAANPQATMDDVLRTKIPLRVAFDVVLIKANDAEEEILREIFSNLAPPGTAGGEPLVAPIFGRGRLLAPAPASIVDENRVFEGCAYLCGACACMVKQQNPGMDLPFRFDWDADLKPVVAVIDRQPAAPEVIRYGTPPPAKETPIGWRTILIAAALISCLLFAGWAFGKRGPKS